MLASRTSGGKFGYGMTVAAVDGALALVLPATVAGALTRSATRGRGRGWLIHRALLLADVLGLCLAFVLQQICSHPEVEPRHRLAYRETLIFALSLPVWVVMAQVAGLYGRAISALTMRR